MITVTVCGGKLEGLKKSCLFGRPKIKGAKIFPKHLYNSKQKRKKKIYGDGDGDSHGDGKIRRKIDKRPPRFLYKRIYDQLFQLFFYRFDFSDKVYRIT